MLNLQAKLTQLETQREQAIANVHALNGAIELIKQLIKEAEEQQPTNPA